MIAEYLIGFVLGYFSGLVAGVIVVIVLFFLEKRGKSTTSLPSQTGADIVNQTWTPYLSNITNPNREGMLPKNPNPPGFGTGTTDSPQQRAARFRVVKDRDGNESSQENGSKEIKWTPEKNPFGGEWR